MKNDKIDKIIPPDEIKKIELDILIFIDTICREHKLRYYLAFGTLLGAVRHQGFIPWDDDIDIYMPRKDYEKLIEIIKEKRGTYKLLSPESETGYYYSHAKVVDIRTGCFEKNVLPINDLGVWVDIFPLDGIPVRKYGYMKKMFLLNKMRALASYPSPPYYKSGSPPFILWVAWKICTWVGFKRILKILNNTSKKYEYDDHDSVGCAVALLKHSHHFTKKTFEPAQTLFFENIQVSVPNQYKEYLTRMYGEYMIIPPVDKRITHHFTAFYR